MEQSGSTVRVKIEGVRNRCDDTQSFSSAMHCLKKKVTKRKKTFLQIGANDGYTNDPLYPLINKEKDKWIGLLVEPTPENYDKLLKLHSDASHWGFLNGAVAGANLCINNEITFYHGVEGTAPDGKPKHWIHNGQVNNVNPKGPHNQHLEQSKRPCSSSITDLIKKHGSREFQKHVALYGLDLLQIDIECMDVEVLKIFPWKTKANEDSQPNAIAVNHVHYESLECMGSDGIALAQDILKKNDYSVYEEGGAGRDTYASRIPYNPFA